MADSELRSELRIGSRGSGLALAQANWVSRELTAAWPGLRCQIVVITTLGDRVQDRPLPEFGGKGVFTEEIGAALRAAGIDLAVHSLKDLPVAGEPGLTLGAICQREDQREVLVSRHGVGLADLPANPRIGTSSLRRASQILALRPDARIMSLRGNVDTRLRKAATEDYDAIILAAAGLARLGLLAHVTEWLSLDDLLPAPGQGALAIQCRDQDRATLTYLAALHHPETAAAVTAERAFLEGLGGGCHAPIAALGEIDNGEIRLRGFVGSPDGREAIRVAGTGSEPRALGLSLARAAIERGAQKWLTP